MEDVNGSSSVKDATNLGIQQRNQQTTEDQIEFNPDRADFPEPSVPTESACIDISVTFNDQASNFPQPPSHQPLAQQALSPTNSVTRETLNQRTQQLIDDINAKRKRDTTMLADFKKAIELEATTSCDNLEQAMYQMYEANGKVIQGKLQDLFATLDRISKLEMELDQFKNSLGALYTDIHGAAGRPT